MRALVIDDEKLVLDGLDAFLQATVPDLSLDKTSDVTTALDLIASVSYELVLLDWHLLGPEGKELRGDVIVEAIRRRGSGVPILVVSGDEQIDWSAMVLHYGLAGMVSKSASGTELINAIQVVIHGGMYLPPSTRTNKLDMRFRRANTVDKSALRERYPELTERQAEVFEVMKRGLSDKHIARELGVAESTVKSHVRAILDVLGVRRRGEAVFKANE